MVAGRPQRRDRAGGRGGEAIDGAAMAGDGFDCPAAPCQPATDQVSHLPAQVFVPARGAGLAGTHELDALRADRVERRRRRHVARHRGITRLGSPGRFVGQVGGGERSVDPQHLPQLGSVLADAVDDHVRSRVRRPYRYYLRGRARRRCGHRLMGLADRQPGSEARQRYQSCQRDNQQTTSSGDAR